MGVPLSHSFSRLGLSIVKQLFWGALHNMETYGNLHNIDNHENNRENDVWLYMIWYVTNKIRMTRTMG